MQAAPAMPGDGDHSDHGSSDDDSDDGGSDAEDDPDAAGEAGGAAAGGQPGPNNLFGGQQTPLGIVRAAVAAGRSRAMQAAGQMHSAGQGQAAAAALQWVDGADQLVGLLNAASNNNQVILQVHNIVKASCCVCLLKTAAIQGL